MAFLVPALRILGLAATGFALAVGWKLGSELVDVAMGKKDLKWPEWPQKGGTDAEREELLKRKFPKMSDD